MRTRAIASLRRPVAAPGAVMISRGATPASASEALVDSLVYDSGTTSSVASAVSTTSVVVSLTATVLLVRCYTIVGWPWLLRDLGDLEGHRRLRLVRVLRACVDLELVGHLTAEAVVREHALDRLLDGALGVGLEQLGVRGGTQTARVARVAVGELLLTLLAGQRDLAGVDDDDEVATVDVRRERRLVLAAQQRRGLGREAAEHDVGGVDDDPVALQVGGLGAERAHGISLRSSGSDELRRSWRSSSLHARRYWGSTQSAHQRPRVAGTLR